MVRSLAGNINKFHVVMNFLGQAMFFSSGLSSAATAPLGAALRAILTELSGQGSR